MSDNVFPSTAPNSAARAIGCCKEPPAKSPKGWMPPVKRQYSDATPRNLLERIRKVTPWDVDRWEDDANLASMLPVLDEVRAMVLADLRELTEELEYEDAVRVLKAQNEEHDAAAKRQHALWVQQCASKQPEVEEVACRTAPFTRKKKAAAAAAMEDASPIVGMVRDKHGKPIFVFLARSSVEPANTSAAAAA